MTSMAKNILGKQMIRKKYGFTISDFYGIRVPEYSSLTENRNHLMGIAKRRLNRVQKSAFDWNQ